VGTALGGLLPPPPAAMDSGVRSWSWDGLDHEAFQRLTSNHAAWHEQHSDPDCPETILKALDGRGSIPSLWKQCVKSAVFPTWFDWWEIEAEATPPGEL
jgi:hypothetical protein